MPFVITENGHPMATKPAGCLFLTYYSDVLRMQMNILALQKMYFYYEMTINDFI